MRGLVLALAALALAACGERPAEPIAADGCAREATHAVTFSDAAAPDIVTARSEGPSCTQAVVVLTIRRANGDPLWALASTYYDMTAGGAAPEGAPEATLEQMDAFLAAWADLTIQRSGALPEWRAGAATLAESVEGFSYDTPFERENYESLRARDLPQVCYAAAVAASQCLIIDPASNAPTVMVYFGP